MVFKLEVPIGGGPGLARMVLAKDLCWGQPRLPGEVDVRVSTDGQQPKLPVTYAPPTRSYDRCLLRAAEPSGMFWPVECRQD